MNKLFIDLEYDLNDNSYKVNSNIKEEKRKDVISIFLRTQIGKGEDSRVANDRDVYNIKLSLDLSFDNFKVEDNCGNLGLRDGILLGYLQKD